MEELELSTEEFLLGSGQAVFDVAYKILEHLADLWVFYLGVLVAVDVGCEVPDELVGE